MQMVKNLSLQENKLRDKISSIILCAGEGIRISEYISNKPKPLIEIDEKPILSHLISHLIKSQITSITIVTGHLKEQIENYITEIKEKNDSLQDKILLVNSKDDYKKGPLYSFLSITNDKNILKRDLIYLVFPGDTYFEFNLINELITSVKNNFALIQDNSMIFYQELQGIKLKKSEDSGKTISTIRTEELKSVERVKHIEQIKLNSIRESAFYKKIIPVFVFGFKFIENIIDAEKETSVKTIREIVNLLIKGENYLYAFRLSPKSKFFDIDTKLDFLNLKKEKRGQ